MGKILIGCASCLAAVCGNAHAQPQSDRHQWTLELDTIVSSADSSFDSWTSGGLSKLRHGEPNDGLNAARLFVDYRGRISPRLWTRIVADYVDDASAGLDLTEAYIDWQPTSRNQHQVKLGAFYPPLSLENGERGWNSPFTYSYSAINTWLGEEIRPIGVEWSMRRHLDYSGSPHELVAFASGFYGNDPAGTLLFWRGWAMHDRQSRLNDVLPMPPMPIFRNGAIVGNFPQSVEPFEEIDDRPGAYAGVEWRYARRGLVQLAHYDNRADPEAFRDGQWGWDTQFTQLAAQISLPAELGLVAQWLEGDTVWMMGARANGTLSPIAEIVTDGFEAKFLMLTRRVGGAHRISLRYDDFAMAREGSGDPTDSGHAWTIAYRYERSARLAGGVEWLTITSRRDQWSEFYSVDPLAEERQLRLQVSLKLGQPRPR